jgi:hypothetical protein
VAWWNFNGFSESTNNVLLQASTNYELRSTVVAYTSSTVPRSLLLSHFWRPAPEVLRIRSTCYEPTAARKSATPCPEKDQTEVAELRGRSKVFGMLQFQSTGKLKDGSIRDGQSRPASNAVSRPSQYYLVHREQHQQRPLEQNGERERESKDQRGRRKRGGKEEKKG